MTSASSAYPRSGFHFTNPKFMLPFVTGAGTMNNVSGTTNSASTAAGFFTNLAANGSVADTDFTAGVAKEIASLSGPGEIIAAVGPTSGGTETTTFTLILDGVTYTSPAFAVASGSRAALTIGLAGATGAEYTTANGGAGGLSWDATKTIDTGNRQIPLWGAPLVWASPRLVFSVSAVLRITHSANVTGTGSQERQSGYAYRMLPVFT